MARTGQRMQVLKHGTTIKSAVKAKEQLLLDEACETAARIRDERAEGKLRPLSPLERAAVAYAGAVNEYAERLEKAGHHAHR